jgi:hypothetical protein
VAGIVAVALVAGVVAVGVTLTKGSSNNNAVGSPTPPRTTQPGTPAVGLAPSVFLDDPSFGRPRVNGSASFHSGVGTISGRTLPDSLLFDFDAQEPFTATYGLPGRHSSFVAWIGINDEAGFESVRFDVLVDGSPQPPREVSPGPAQEYVVELPTDAKTLTLSMQPGDCPGILQCDTEAIWASASLQGTGRPLATPTPPPEGDQPLRALSDEGRMHILDVDGAPSPKIADNLTLDGRAFPDSFIYDIDSCNLSDVPLASTSWDLDQSFRSLDVSVGLEKLGACVIEVDFSLDHSLEKTITLTRSTPPVDRTISVSGKGLLQVDLIAKRCQRVLDCSTKVVLGDPRLKGTA